MKKLFTKEDIEQQMKALQVKLDNEYLSPAQEKTTIKEIEDL